MYTIARVQAPCKINIHLELGKKRSDNYHELRSIFQAVSLFDELELTRSFSPGPIIIESRIDCPLEKNTVYIASDLFRKAIGSNEGIKIRLKKNIPDKAGLGGGSSDAAFTLIALNSLFDAGMAPLELAEIGARVGSDVPFFLCESTCAFVGGRGELVKPITARLDFTILIIRPSFTVSTKEAFHNFDKLYLKDLKKSFLFDIVSELESEYQKNVSEWAFFNDFEVVLEKDFSEIQEIKRLLKDNGAEYAQLSGSGSCLFGVFASTALAERAQKALSKFSYESYVSIPLACMPNVVLE